MIANLQNKGLIISFGLGLTEITVKAGDNVLIYINSIFNENEYTINLKGLSGRATGLGFFEITADTTIEIQIELIKKDLTIIKSNIIKLIVI